MRALRYVAVCCALCACAIGFAGPVTEAEARKGIMAAFDSAVKSFKAKDIKGFMSVYTPDYTSKANGKTMSAKEMEAEMKMNMSNTKSVESATLSLGKVAVKGEAATADATFSLKATIADPQGRMGKPGATHKMGVVEKAREIWVKTKGGWKNKRSDMISETMTLDGKPFNPMAPPPGPGKPVKHK